MPAEFIVGMKYVITAISVMGETKVEGVYVESENGVHYFTTQFASKVGYDPELGWKFRLISCMP